MTDTKKLSNGRRLKAVDMAYIALAAVLIAVCSWTSIPGAVPYTLQTFAVFFTLSLLGGKRGTLAVTVYLLLGAVGVPVFAEFSGGLGSLLGATGGYLVGFLAIALCYWVATARFGRGTAVKVVSLSVGLLLCYAFGTLWFAHVYGGGGAVSFGAALMWCVVPFVLPDAAKLALALTTVGLLEKRLPGKFN